MALVLKRTVIGSRNVSEGVTTRRVTLKQSTSRTGRLVGFIFSVAAGGGFLVYGIFKEEIGEVLFNAAML